MPELTLLRTRAAKVFDLGGLKREIRTGIPSKHYQQAPDQPWDDIDSTLEPSGIALRPWQARAAQYGFEVGDDGKRRIYPNRWLYPGRYIEIGGLANLGVPTISGRSIVWDRANWRLSLESISDGIKGIILLRNSLAPKSFSFSVGFNNLSVQKQSIPNPLTGEIRQEYRLLVGNEVVARMPVAFAVDARGTVRLLTESFQAGQFTMTLDTTGLTYPIVIDPTTIDVSVGASADDAYTFVSGGTGYLDYTAAGIYVDYDAFANTMRGYVRFTGLAAANGTTIDGAYWDLRAHLDFTGVNCTIAITALDEDNTANFNTTYANLNGRASTTASVSWAITDWVSGTRYGDTNNQQELKTIVQEMSDSSFLASGVLAFRTTISVSGNAQRRFSSYDTLPSSAADLRVLYTAGGAAFVPRIMVI